MRISDRYRQIFDDLTGLLDRMGQKEKEQVAGGIQALCNSADELEVHLDTVGEIPQIKLDQRLSPVLLGVHTQLDRARVLFESVGMEQMASNIWELEQQVYRLLNDL